MALTINYQGLKNKYSKSKKGKTLTASEWVNYKEWKKLQEKPVIKPKEKKKIKKILTYEELLNDDRWKKKRDKILKKSGYACSICKSSNKLQVHHLYYEKGKNGKWKNPWNYPDEALVVLCEDCHKEMHDLKKKGRN